MTTVNQLQKISFECVYQARFEFLNLTDKLVFVCHSLERQYSVKSRSNLVKVQHLRHASAGLILLMQLLCES